MNIRGIEVQSRELSYDKIIKNTLSQYPEMTVRFINGLFGDNIPLDATVEWLDKESVDDQYKAIVADSYPRVNGRMYAIEFQESDRGDMALRVFRYAVGGAMHHSMTAYNDKVTIEFPQSCVVFLKSTAHTPKRLVWDIKFPDGQSVSLNIPTVRLSDLSIEDIATRDLFPIGQFYLRTFEPLTKAKLEPFRVAANDLLIELKKAIDAGSIPHHIAEAMAGIIRTTAENVAHAAKFEGVELMITDILETLPYYDFSKAYRELEERSEARGEAIGEAKTFRVIIDQLIQMGASDEALASLTVPGLPKDKAEEIIREIKREHALNAMRSDAPAPGSTIETAKKKQSHER